MEQSQNVEDVEIQTSSASEDNTQDDEIVQKIEQLLYQDKTVAITEVVNLTILSLKQQKKIALLNKNLKQEFKDKQIKIKIHNSEAQCRSDVGDIEKERDSLANKLNAEYNQMSVQFELYAKIRSQLKNDIGAGRAAMDVLNKRLYEMKEIANKYAMEYDTLMTRYNTCKSDLTGRIEQLKGQNDALRASYIETTTKYETMIKEHEANAMEVSDKLTRTEEKFRKLQSEADQWTKLYENLKLGSEQEVAHFQQEMEDFEEEMKKQHHEQFLAYDKKKCQLEGETLTIENEIRTLQEKARDLTEANERFRSLQEQRKQNSEQRIPKGGAIAPGGTQKPHNLDAAKMPSSVTTDTNFDLNCIESYHYDNEMSLMSFTSNGNYGQHSKNHKKK